MRMVCKNEIPFEWSIDYLDEVVSTMDIARENAEQGAQEGYVIQGGVQTGGRGRRGNQWESPLGNIYMSFVLRPEMERQTWGQLAFVMAVALGNVVGDQARLKWPNDIMVDDKKLAGILIEAANDFVIVGTGINVAHAPDGCIAIQDCGLPYDRDIARDLFLNEIADVYSEWQIEGFEPIRQKWLTKAYRLGEPIKARLPSGEYDGVFEGVNAQGFLLLRQENGLLKQIDTGEIIHAIGD